MTRSMRDMPAPGIMSSIILNGTYERMLAGEIVREIQKTHLECAGIRQGRIDDGTLLTLHLNYRTPKSALDFLAETHEFIWWVDPLNRLHFQAP